MFAIKRSLGEATYCRLLIIFRPPYVQCSCFIQKVATRLGYSLLQEAESVGQRTFVAGLFFHLFSSHALTKVSPLYVASLECKHSHACDLTWNVLDTKLGPQRKKPPSRQSDLRQGMQLRRIHGGVYGKPTVQRVNKYGIWHTPHECSSKKQRFGHKTRSSTCGCRQFQHSDHCY